MIRKIVVLGDENFDDAEAIKDWVKALPEGTIVLPVMREGNLVKRMRFFGRRQKVSVMLSMNYADKWKLANEVAVFGTFAFSGQERAQASGLPWTLVEEADAQPEEKPAWMQLEMFEV